MGAPESINNMGITRFLTEVEGYPVDVALERFDWSRDEGKKPWYPVADIDGRVIDFYSPDQAEAAEMRSWLNQYKIMWDESINAYRVVYD